MYFDHHESFDVKDMGMKIADYTSQRKHTINLTVSYHSAIDMLLTVGVVRACAAARARDSYPMMKLAAVSWDGVSGVRGLSISGVVQLVDDPTVNGRRRIGKAHP